MLLQKYLDKKYETTGLFGYLKDNATHTDLSEEKEVFTRFPNLGLDWRFFKHVIPSRLPLPFLRTTQSRNLFDSIASRPPEEQQLPGEKSGKMVIEAAREDFVETEGKEVNQRLSRKLDKMMQNNARFFINVGDMNKIEEEMQQLTLSGFKRRVLTPSGL